MRYDIHYDIETPCRILSLAGCLLTVVMFCPVYLVRELLLRLLYTSVPITPAADTASRTSHSMRLLLSPVCTLVVALVVGVLAVGFVVPVGFVVSVGSVVDFV